MRLDLPRIDEIARRFAAGERVAPADLQALCEMARELLRATPSQETVRVAMLLVSSRGALPLKSSQGEALGAAVLAAAQGALLESLGAALQEAGKALLTGKNWIHGLEQLAPQRKIGAQLGGLARSMTKTMHRHLASTGRALNFGMASGQLEPFDPKEIGYKEIPPFAQLARRECATDLERAQESLRLARLGILKLARFTHALSASPSGRLWDEALARQAALAVRDAEEHLQGL
jgi:hypothetical protein